MLIACLTSGQAYSAPQNLSGVKLSVTNQLSSTGYFSLVYVGLGGLSSNLFTNIPIAANDFFVIPIEFNLSREERLVFTGPGTTLTIQT